MNNAHPTSETPRGTPGTGPGGFLYPGLGFSRIFWGLFLGLALFFARVTLEAFWVQVPGHIMGAAMVLWGLLTLKRDGGDGAWTGLVTFATLMSLVQIYLSPFLMWWASMPENIFFTANNMVLISCSILLLLAVNLISARLAGLAGEKGLRLAALVCAASVLSILAAPFGGIMWHAATLSRQTGCGLGIAFLDRLNAFPQHYYALLLIPCSFTLTVVWKTKEMCYARIDHDRTNAGLRERPVSHGTGANS